MTLSRVPHPSPRAHSPRRAMADAADASAADRWLAEAKSLVKQHAFHMKRATVRGNDARGRRRARIE